MPIPKYVYVKSHTGSDERSISLLEDESSNKDSLALEESHSSLSLRSWRSRWDASEAAACADPSYHSRPSIVHWMRNTGPVNLTNSAPMQQNQSEQKLQPTFRSLTTTMGTRPTSPTQPKKPLFAPPSKSSVPRRRSGRVRLPPRAPVRKLSNPPPSELLAALFQEK